MNCPQCRQVLRDGARFCDGCGLAVAAFDTPTNRVEATDSAETLRDDPLIGQTLDAKYELLARLGEGGMGAVYRARRVHIGDEVAVKVLHPRFVNDETLVERFRREARAAAQLHHPNVVIIHDYGEAGGAEAFAYIVMELVRGASLRGVLQSEERLDAARAVSLMRDICAGVGAAHRRQIVHRDLKPDNIIVMPPDDDHDGERVKVVDFGIAKLRDMASDSTLTQAGAVVGTPYYMSPEQCRGESLDARADVYSLGAMLYEMLAGSPPFTAPSVTGVIAKHLTEAPPRIPDDLQVPRALQETVMRALAKDPEARQRDAAEFAREIQAAERRSREEDAARLRAEEERQRAEAEAQRRAEEEAQRRADEERRQLEEAEQRDEAERLEREAAAARLAEEQKRQAEAEQRRQAEEVARKGRAAEEVERERREAEERTRARAAVVEPGKDLPAPRLPTKSRLKWLVAATASVVITVGMVAAWRIQNAELPLSQKKSATEQAPITEQGKSFSENINGVTLEMVSVPGGTFTMGSPTSETERADDEGPQHGVTVQGFYMGKYEVTQGQWRAVMGNKSIEIQRRRPPGGECLVE